MWEGLQEGVETQPEFPDNRSLGSFTIDQGDSRPFNLSLSEAASVLPMRPKSHLLVDLTGGKVSAGEHTVTLITNANMTSLHPPFLFFQLLVEQGNILVDAPPETTSSTVRLNPNGAPAVVSSSLVTLMASTVSMPNASTVPTPIPPTMQTPDRPVPVGAIVGGTMGGLCLLIAALFWARRRSRGQLKPVRLERNGLDAFVSRPIVLIDMHPMRGHTGRAPPNSAHDTDSTIIGSEDSTSDNAATVGANSSGRRLSLLPPPKGQHLDLDGNLNPDPGVGSLAYQHQDSDARLYIDIPPVYTIE